MPQNADIFSIRVVIADFYLEKPISGLDLCYTEFRGNQIKKVPIIRIFGSNSLGQKTCTHVHGVFPYFYVPYESKDFESLNKAIYQIAFSLDKALNVSLGQANSAAQHVFKIQLVKGIPFYGYHRREHHYLKIYMYNPRFVRRAANLLQNGAILGKVFHPHESHVPYVLQFMIDYNLYGMSFMHVPLEVVKFRRQNEADIIKFPHLKPAQILSTTLAKKQSCSALEVDIGANFILNRFQIATKNNASKHSNPGVEAIWHDEDLRRQKLIQSLGDDEERLNAIPRLEVPATQERPLANPTESEIFYRVGLLSKLEALEQSLSGSGSLLDQTLNNTNLTNSQPNVDISVGNQNSKIRRKFNLKKLLVNSVYPEECSPDENLVNASCIQDHLSAKNSFQNSDVESKHDFATDSSNNTLVDESAFLENTIIDEDLITSLTQEQQVPLNASLRAEDMELLDVLQQLEEHGEQPNPIDMELLDVLQQLEEQGEHHNPIDLDSSLAPLSQSHKDFTLTPEVLDKEIIAAASNQLRSDSENESENEDNSNMHDFSIALDDIDELLLKISQSQIEKNTKAIKSNESNLNLAQLDGVDDVLLKTPEKRRKSARRKGQQTTPPRSNTPKRNGILKSPQRSPRTPKPNAASKYAPLPIVFSNNSAAKKMQPFNEASPGSVPKRLNFETAVSTLPLHKKLAITKMRRKTISSAKELLNLEQNTDTAKIEVSKSVVRTRRSRKASIDLDKTHVTCALTPRRRKSERLLKTCKVDEANKNIAIGISKNLENPNEKKQKNAKQSLHKKTTKQSIKSQSGLLEKTNVIKRLVVKIPRKDLQKLAARFQKERMSSKTNNEGLVIEAYKNEITKPNESLQISNTEKTEILGIPEPSESLALRDPNNEGNIVASSSQFVDLPQQNIESETECTELPSLRISEESYNAIEKNMEPSLPKCAVETQQSLEESTNASNDNIRRNLSQLTRLFQNFDSFQNPDSTCKNKATNSQEDSNEEIAASDTESTPNVLKIKRTSSLKRFRRSFLSKSNLRTPNTPKTPTTNLCDLSMSITSTSVFSEYSSPVLTPEISPENEEIMLSQTKIDHEKSKTSDLLIFEPPNSPPTREYVKKACEKFQIYEYDFQRPFYSNPEDITKAKEVGFTVLQIPGNKLSDCPVFQSVLGTNIMGLANWRRSKLQEIGGTQALQHYKTTERMREYLATKKQVVIELHIKAPTRHDAKVWLKARELLKNQDEASKKDRLLINEDSPIKIRRQKITMMFNDDTGTAADADDLNYTSCSLTLTPLTPATPMLQTREVQFSNSNQTPLTANCESSIESKKSTGSVNRRRSKRFKSIKTSLNEKLKAAADKEMEHDTNSKAANAELLESLSSSQQSNASTDDSSSVSSQVVLAELERSSFIKRLKAGETLNKKAQLDVSFGLTSASLNNTFGFKVNLENLQEAKADIECNCLTTIIMELFVPTRGDLHPNPEYDEIRCIFYAIDNNIPRDSSNHANETMPQKACGYILVNDLQDIVQHEGKIHGIDADIKVKIVKTEVEALEALLELCSQWDADIYAGYEIEMSSWGYVIERAKFLCLNIAPLLSRVPSQKVRDFDDEERDQFTFTDLDVEMKLCGRILLDVWRLMRAEIALTSYTFENVMYHILHKRCPWHNYRNLTTWFASPCSRWIVLEYYLERVRGVLSLLDQLDLLGRTSEMAKLIGIQFYEVLSRGSQFRVESMMLRIAKPRNLVPLSPSVQQRAHMRAPEYLPLILEPQSRFYADPVIVLDFQSLYPSMIIAYNYCFSTCLGRVEHLGNSAPFEFGASQLRVSPKMLRKLVDENLVNISPCGVVFVKASVREGILPRMLTEILDTRQMVKQSMKLHKSNSALQRILHSRQLGLKLMANVTYGYTAANFSGRMPAVEVGDSVVAKGRETLERAIKMVEANAKWGVKVVYGDTDSLFVQVPGRNREQAFKIGEEIAAETTKLNPHPVKLKLEKVYQPCILQTKKRYVGYMYETADQTEPIYEAKGIETVRRDGCPAVAKMLEKVLRILFETTDVSQVKQYVCRQFTKLLSGRANLQDLIFAKEFRGLNGYKPTACVPALEMTRKWIQTDPRRIPRRGERVPFIITNGPPGVPLIRLIRTPHEVLDDVGLKINAIYYITKAIIPALNRCLLLIGADVNEWFANLPRKILMTPALSTGNEIITAQNQQQQQHKKTTISQYFSTTNCIVDCGRQTKEGICNTCMHDATKCVITLEWKISKIERAFHLTQNICQACCGRVGDLKCGSLECPVLYVFENKKRDLKQIDYFRKLLEKF